MKKFKKIPLSYPIIRDENGTEVEVSSVTIYRMKLKHLRALPKELLEKLQQQGENASLTMDEAIPLLLQITSLTEKDIDELDIADFKKISDMMGSDDFLS
jgi:hypothetical protein